MVGLFFCLFLNIFLDLENDSRRRIEFLNSVCYTLNENDNYNQFQIKRHQRKEIIMTAEVVTYMASNQNMEQRIQFELVAQCAPFLKGMRTASVLNVEKSWVRKLYRLIEGTDISCRILVVRGERCLALFYRKHELAERFSVQEVREFLMEYGYEEEELERKITRLSMRMNRYSKNEIAFPHEIGVFLDYPLKDVKAFIKNNGKRSLLTGYWKVYHNPERARLTFLAYDKAKDSAVNEFLIGKSVSEIAKVSA